ncbi:MAG TPA: CBS domain-containing protein [Longimicrobiaceae bacterium]|jgi:CBS domain-containing protein|nr:CBS domain-containing protein [Longimicrobiaceae bacterium]
MSSSAPMRLSEVLRPEHVVVPLEAASVGGAVRALAERLRSSGDIADPAALEALLAEPLARDVVHVGEQVVLPHLRTDAVRGLAVALGVASAPLREGGREGEARIVVLVLAPPTASHLYLQTVAALARALRSDDVVERLLAARSVAEVLAIEPIANLTIHPRLTVRDVMTQRVYRVRPETPVREVLELMGRNDLKAVPVVGEKREVLGMVTERDLLRHLFPNVLRTGGEPAEGGTQPGAGTTAVREIMTRSVMCVSEDQALSDVASIMINKDVERLPVVSEGKLTGFLTRGDILRKLFGR